MSKLTTLWTYLTTPKVYTSRKAIEKIQRKGMAKHVKMVRKNSPVFSRHWAGLADEDWREFPLVNKAIMMEHLQDYITADIDVESARAMAAEAEQSRDFHPTLKGYTVGFSSGTSGARGMHFISQAEQDRWAGYMLAERTGRLHLWQAQTRLVPAGQFQHLRVGLIVAHQVSVLRFDAAAGRVGRRIGC